MNKVSYIGNWLYQIDNDTTPIDEESLKHILLESGLDEVQAGTWLEEARMGEVKELDVTARKGVIVDLYEVDYPTPSSPQKETQELARNLDEEHDFITQYLFPGATTEEVIVGLRSDILSPKKYPKKKLLTIQGIDRRKLVKRAWDVYTPSDKGGWGFLKKDRVEAGDILRAGEEYYRFIAPISYKKMVVGQIYGDSYSAFNSGYDVFEFYGYSSTDDAPAPEYETIEQVYQKFGVRSLRALEELKHQRGRGEVDFRMWTKQNDIGLGGYYYISNGRWCRGSGAEPLTFWQVEPVAVTIQK